MTTKPSKAQPTRGVSARHRRQDGAGLGCRTASRGRGPAVDLAGLDQNVGYVVRRAQVWIFQDVKRTFRNLEISPAQYSVLKVIGANPGIAQARVAEALCIERARLVDMLDRLEARRLITRARSSRDRRSHALGLTQAGIDLLGRLTQLIAEHERHVIAKIGAKGKTEVLRILAPFLTDPD